ncbi:hypothetical protein [Haloarcula amylolytica]|uniref:hypothetical protein n=1 Tax=Haloarcula amylolytica TaxID=396317 RepID=UPI003C730E8A
MVLVEWSAWVEFLYLYALMCVMFLIFGFFTVKFTTWGIIGTMAASAVYKLIPGQSVDISTPINLIIELWTIYPDTYFVVVSHVDGLLSVSIITLLYGLVIFPYLVGILFALIWWPELIIFRVLF